MTYLAIDTGSWLDLISDGEINPQIETLKHWIDNENVQVIIPEKVREEWHEQKNKIKKDLHDSLRNKYKSTQEIIDVIRKTTNSDPGTLNLDLVFIDQQIDAIEDLILRSKQLETPQDIKLFVYERSLRKPYKAPFHNNVKSLKDAEIYFSSLDYCSKNAISELYFISGNTKEFGHPLKDTPSKGSATQIHFELTEDFPQVAIKYFSRIGHAVSDLGTFLPSIPRKEVVTRRFDQGNFYVINKNLSVVDTLEVLFRKIYDELRFLPTKILSKIPPFKNGVDEVVYYDAFSLTISNEELYNFFEKASNELKDAEADNFTQNKAIYILERLTQNLIFNVKNRRSNKGVSTYHYKFLSGETIEHYYSKFDFKNVLKKRHASTLSLMEKFRCAYVLYQTGNYLKAKILYEEVANEAKKNGKNVVYFISQYNLSKLAVFVESYYWRDEIVDKDSIVTELKKIDLQMIAKNLSHQHSNKLFEFVIQEEFFSDASQKIHDIVAKIVDQYFSHLNGGSSHNNYSDELTAAFAELDYMVNENCLVYDSFLEFENLFQKVIEGWFASHAIASKNHSRLESFDDYSLSKIIYYGKREEIVKFFNRYKLKNLEYRPTENGGHTFMEFILNILSNPESVLEFSDNFCENNGVFLKRFNQVFENSLTLAALLKLSPDEDKQIAELILSFIESENVLYWYRYQAVRMFFSRKAKNLNDDVLIRLFKLTFSCPKLHEHEFIETLLEKLAGKGIVVSLTLDETELFLERIFQNCKKCNSKHSKYQLTCLYKVLSIEQRLLVKQRIQQFLDDKFDAEMCYLSVLFDLLPMDEKMFQKYIDRCDVLTETRRVSLFGKGYMISGVSDFVNLCFKLRIDLSEKKFDKIREYSLYYEWLLDMNAFDYEKFDIEWVLDYPTVYYYREMSKSQPLITALTTYLRENSNSEVEKVLLKIIHFVKYWE